jgi:ATP-dependent DNA ligase
LNHFDLMLATSASMGEQGVRLYEAAGALQLEGIVAKRADSRYAAGRSKD